MINKIIIIGRCGNDPEIVSFKDNGTIAKLNLAVSEKYKNRQGETVENTEWFNLIFRDKLSEIVEKYVKKGDMIYVEGKLKTRTYEKDGEKRYITEIHCSLMQMLGGKKQDSVPVKQKENHVNDDMEDDMDNLPF